MSIAENSNIQSAKTASLKGTHRGVFVGSGHNALMTGKVVFSYSLRCQTDKLATAFKITAAVGVWWRGSPLSSRFGACFQFQEFGTL
jgi:hypothetical protein